MITRSTYAPTNRERLAAWYAKVAGQRDVQRQVEEMMASKNKYVIRVQHAGERHRYYFTSRREAEAFAKAEGLPKSQIKAL